MQILLLLVGEQGHVKIANAVISEHVKDDLQEQFSLMTLAVSNVFIKR